MTAGAYPGFCSMKRLGILLLLLDGMLVHRRKPPSISSGFPDSLLVPIYSFVERGTWRVKCLAQEHNTMTRPGLEPGRLDTESSALTTRPPRLPQHVTAKSKHRSPVIIFSMSLPSHIPEAVKSLFRALPGAR